MLFCGTKRKKEREQLARYKAVILNSAKTYHHTAPETRVETGFNLNHFPEILVQSYA